MSGKTVSLLSSLLFTLMTVSAADATPLEPASQKAVTQWLALPEADRPPVSELGLPTGLTAEESAESLEVLWEFYRASVKDDQLGALPQTLTELAEDAPDGRVQLKPQSLTLGELEMPFIVLRREKQDAPANGRPLFICTHGGGANGKVDNAHAWPVNTREWQTQVSFAARLYKPEGIYFVPRMADDRLGRWWHRHNHDAFERVIEHGIAHWGVDPNRVYLLGISEGGYGTDILAPFMPDRFGGANAMAAGVDLANPPENLRNLAFRTDVGEKDKTFNRVGLAQRFHARLDELREVDPKGYNHFINVQQGKGHGIDYRPGIEWIAQQQRDPWPEQLVWTAKDLHDRRRTRHYWIEVDGLPTLGRDMRIRARAIREHNQIIVDADQIELQGDAGNPTHAKEGQVIQEDPLVGVTLRVLLHDRLLDLDKPIRISVNGKERFVGSLQRDAATQLRTLCLYGDATMAASAEIVIPLEQE